MSEYNEGIYIVACQAHPALVKLCIAWINLVTAWSQTTNNGIAFQYRLKGPRRTVSRHCQEPRRFIGDPALLAHDNISVIGHRSISSPHPDHLWSSPYTMDGIGSDVHLDQIV